MVVSSRSTGDQDLLHGRMDVVPEHGVLVGSLEQVVHYGQRLFGERLEKMSAQIDTSLEDL